MGNKTSMNLEENVAGLLCYIGTWITGIIFYLLEKENKKVRFHALQSIIVFLPLTIIAPILGWLGSPKVSYGGGFTYSYDPGIPALIWLSWLFYLLIFILWIVLMIMAYQDKEFNIPVVSDIAKKHA